MSSKIQRADKIFERIQARTGLTEAGKDWLIAVLDPFHDEKLMVSGYPDREVSPSVVQVIKQTLAIAKPTTYGANDIWGFHVRIDDTLFNSQCIGTSGSFVLTTVDNAAQFDYTAGAPTSSVKYGGLTIIYFDQTVNGTTEIVVSPVTEATTSNRAVQMEIDAANFGVGKTRVLSQGFEVVNTTSELYKGGALAVYEQPGSKEQPFTVYTFAVNLNPGAYPQQVFVDEHDDHVCDDKSFDDCEHHMVPVASFKPIEISMLPNRNFFVKSKNGYTKLDLSLLPNLVYPGASTWQRDVLPPRSLAELMILPGSQQWDAKKGCMCVATMNDMENPPSFGIPIGKWFIINELTYPIPTGFEVSPLGNTTGSYMTQVLSTGFSAAGTSFGLIPENMNIPFNTKGAVVSGQQPSATFTLNYNVIVERIISSQDRSLATLAKPSPPEDYVAIQLYSEMSQRIPIGVAQSDNDFGDWILGMADQVANVVSTIGKPVLQMVDSFRESRTGANPTGSSFNTPKSTPNRVVKQVVVQQQKKKKGPPIMPPLPPIPGKKPMTKAQTKKAKKRTVAAA
jgi:hypothetical protein